MTYCSDYILTFTGYALVVAKTEEEAYEKFWQETRAFPQNIEIFESKIEEKL